MDDIIKAIASKHAGSVIRAINKQAEPAYVEPVRTSISPASGSTYLGSERLGPTTRIITGIRREKPIPRRKPVEFNEFNDGELEDLLRTRVERNWYFETWLEYMGLPRDLDHRLDPIFGVCLDAYMARKRESHGR